MSLEELVIGTGTDLNPKNAIIPYSDSSLNTGEALLLVHSLTPSSNYPLFSCNLSPVTLKLVVLVQADSVKRSAAVDFSSTWSELTATVTSTWLAFHSAMPVEIATTSAYMQTNSLLVTTQ